MPVLPSYIFYYNKYEPPQATHERKHATPNREDEKSYTIPAVKDENQNKKYDRRNKAKKGGYQSDEKVFNLKAKSELKR